ncbi:IS4 family transposase [Runella zeae]|uniref:IS4 family transposase n=1 Tax=Runella zeae TaxID=94255 RepID=UPI000684F609|nr:IS4 family transposase [Runella zeae]
MERAKRFVKWVYQDSSNKPNWLMEDKNIGINLHLQRHLGWHKARVKFLELLIVSLIRTRTVVFSINAVSLNDRIICSNLRRIQRFFSDFTIDFDVIAKILMAINPIKGPYKLSLDRTNWQFSGINYNILCLTIVADGVSLPLLWTMLNKRGNSNQDERKALLMRYIRLFGLASIECLIADREFIGQEWISFLAAQPIKFYIRIRENLLVNQKGRELKTFWLFNNLPLNQVRQLYKPLVINEQWVYLTGMRIINSKNQVEYIIVATYQFDCQTMQVYAKRWSIECFLKSIKSAGFNIEGTHLTDQKRLEKLFAVVCIAFVWVYIVGQYQNRIKQIPILRHQRRAFSIFRYGLDEINRALLFDLQLVNKYSQLLTYT